MPLAADERRRSSPSRICTSATARRTRCAGCRSRFARGEVFGFIGPNGAGKTSTIKVLATLLKPTRGRALVAGLDVRAIRQAVRRKIGYMPDFFGVYDDLTASEYLHFFAAAYHIPAGEAEGAHRATCSR